ncbi:Na+/H+ antiporter NhaC family protein [Flavonifractor plautii]|jgi:tetracycline resistance efflux pump|uniref:Na+/H+ antiporter NhaC family protein n=1 Tax=Flavonifractor plautii TaxID=292800 RepID=UPI0004277830|nr:Na+/H+ antiporter NhaC family protein [Flavonifractor plautii]MDB7902566.1 Na+/H+ antiporter NhaC family protein [Flavonifractor plautii]MDS9668630.1 Na+/H+ antiporter NhaC family protein [Flavonifractor plautii]MDU3014020.1 Na+/H+ antiporter NhaC family protein [Flavonifractor plautii]
MNSPRMKRFGQFLLVIFALACVLMTAAFAEGDVEHTSFVWGTVASLLPPVAAIVLALITKEVYSSLFLGIIVGCFLYTNGSPIDAFQDFVSRLTSNAGGNMGILMFLVILGTMVALMIRAGGSKAYGDWAVSHIKTKSGALWSTFILAIVLGVDDYFNNLTTGNVMRPVTDGHHISRAKLSYMCDATAAPVCIMMPVSSWAAAVTGIIGNEEVGFQIFLKAIPYNYYAILTLVFIVVMTCLNIDYGPMRKHENNAAKGDLYTTPERPFAGVEEMKFNPNGKVIDLVLPVLVLVGGCVGSMVYVGYQNGGTDLITAFANTSAFDALPLGSLVALIFTMIFFMVRRAMSFTELMDCLPNGFKQMVPAILILCLAWTIGDVTKALGAPEFVADLVSKFGPGLKNFLPAVVFLIAAFLGFATGTSWGTFTILLPIVIPVFSGGIPAADLTSELINGNDMLMIAIAATLGGAVMGDHCSPISDTTIMASSGAQCYHLNHVATQLPYAMTVAAVCFANYILASFIQNVVINLAIAIVCMVVVLLVIGKLNHSMNRHSQRD